jgi:RNA polymerase sigma factor (sigma-70 family)
MEVERMTPVLEELLAQAAWARGLARALLADPSRAEDVLQETWLAALERPPAELSRPRGWLARALGNAARQLGRAEGRRARRERAGARPERLPSAAELAETLETQRTLAGHVLALEEPYRSTLVLRFYRDLSPSAIARELGVPAATVRSRLARGLDVLRRRLDREHGGDRRAWGVALVRGLALEPARAGGLAALVLAVGLLLGLGGGAAWWAWPENAERAAEPATATLETPEASESTGPAAADKLPRADPGAAEPAPSAARASLAPGAPAPAFFGRVTAPDGTPVAGATISIYPSKSRPRPAPIAAGTSEEDGSFRIPAVPTESTYLVLGAEAEGFQGLTMDPVEPESEIAVTLGWVTDVSGVVRDASGAPIEGVTLRGGAEPVRTDAEGRYRLRGVRTGHEVSLEARHPRFVRQDYALLLRTNEPYVHDWTLAEGVALSIEVVDRETGRPLAGVPVRERRYGDALLATTDAQGRFELSALAGTGLGAYLDLEGYCPTSWSWKIDALEPLPAPRILVQPLGWIVGRVVDEAGKPLAGAGMYTTHDAVMMKRFDLAGEDARAEGVLGRIQYEIDTAIDTAREVEVDAEGHFSAPLVPWDTPYGLHVWCEGYVDLDAGPYLVPSSLPRPEIEIVLARGAVLRGRVLENGEPWEDGSVTLRFPSGKFAAGSSIGSEGRYSIGNAPSGELRAVVADGSDDVRMETVLRFEPGQVLEHDFESTLELVPISGRVLAAPGASMRFVLVFAGPAGEPGGRGDAVQVEADGSFALRVPPGHEYVLTASGYRIESPPVRARPGDTDVVLRLPEVGKLSLRLVEQGSGAPARVRRPDEGLSILCQGEAEPEYGMEATVDVHGILEAERELGLYDLRLAFQEDGYLPVEVRGIEVSRSPPPPRTVELVRGAELELVLEPPDPGDGSPHPARGHLVFLLERGQLGSISGPYPTQEPPANIRWNGICLRIDDPDIRKQNLGLEHGRATLRGLAPGTYSLRAFPDDFVFEPAELELQGSEPRTIRVRWRAR